MKGSNGIQGPKGASSDFSRIAFAALRNSTSLSSSATITYDALLVNIGNAFSHQTGIFTCPESGSYFFSFSAESVSTTSVTSIHIYMVRNGQNELLIDNHYKDDQAHKNLSYQWAIKLHAGDEVKMRIGGSSEQLRVEKMRQIHFRGYLVKAD